MSLKFAAILALAAPQLIEADNWGEALSNFQDFIETEGQDGEYLVSLTRITQPSAPCDQATPSDSTPEPEPFVIVGGYPVSYFNEDTEEFGPLDQATRYSLTHTQNDPAEYFTEGRGGKFVNMVDEENPEAAS